MNPLKPRVKDIHISDIAQALSNMCRFGGHVEVPYSVAEHSVRVAEYVQKKLETSYTMSEKDRKRVILAALMHDSAEAFLVDVPSPVKYQMTGYIKAERRMYKCIAKRFDLVDWCHDLIKEADVVMLMTEKRDLKKKGARSWKMTQRAIPLPYKIKPWTSEGARARFMWKFKWCT